MKKFLLAAALAFTLTNIGTADAHARLDHAEPAVGSTGAAPHAVTLHFSEGVVPRFCSIAITDAAGKAIGTSKPTSVGDAAVLAVSIGRVLAPGTYMVKWHAVSVDTHRTQGTFTFEVAP